AASRTKSWSTTSNLLCSNAHWVKPRCSIRSIWTSLPTTALPGSPPSLRIAHHIENKELRVNIDPRRIPRKMLGKPVTQQEEPDAWILSVSTPCSNCQNCV